MLIRSLVVFAIALCALPVFAGTVKTSSAGPLHALTVDLTSLSLDSTSLHGVQTQCWQGTGFSGGEVTGVLKPVKVVSIDALTTSSITVNFRSDSQAFSNVVCAVTGGSGGGSVDLSGVPANAVLTNASGVVAGASVKAATSAELAGVDLVTNGNFASGLSGWTTAGGWSIVSGRLHHTPGTANKIYRAITVTQYDTYLQQVQVFSQSAGTANVNLGVDCNSDCGEVLSVGSNPWDLVASSDDGATVLEIQPDSASDITISSVGLIRAFPSLYLPALGNSNAADGVLALHSNTIGFSNLASGPFALFSNTEGRFNAAVGASSLQACTGLECSANAGVGAFSLVSNRSSPGNTAVGRYAGSGVVSGNGSNVFVGTNSGTTKADIENSVCIAANCSVALDNQTVIGNSSTVRTDFFGILGSPPHTPASSSEVCTAGQFSDGNVAGTDYHFVCVATNTWKRVALSSF